jgi:hypothetical protein
MKGKHAVVAGDGFVDSAGSEEGTIGTNGVSLLHFFYSFSVAPIPRIPSPLTNKATRKSKLCVGQF